MKRYIRTKDGIYELQKTKSGEKYLVKTNELIPEWNTEKYEVIRQADTVPELCDAFVIVTKDGEKHTYYSYERYVLAMAACEEEGIEVEAYGAIWTEGDENEPILRSVAKRKTTEGKEDLELL